MEYKFIGNVESLKSLPDGIEIKTQEGCLRFHILTDDLVRVRFTKNEEFENDFSYAVIKTDWVPDYQYSEEIDSYNFSTEKLNIKITKNPVRITFSDKENNIISEDFLPFGMASSGTEVQVYKTLDNSEKFFGLGEKVGNLDKRGQYFKMWNTDFPAYGLRQDPLYVSIPFFIGMRKDKAYGYFLDNTYETFFNLGTSQNRYYNFGAKYGELNYYFFYGPQVSDVVERYSELTGKMEMPPLWALGYQQCRWSYYPDTYVEDLVKTFRNKKIPLDVIYLDIDWMDEYRVFQWSKTNFPDPAKLTKNLNDMGVKVVTILDPGIKADNDYSVAKSGLENNHFVKYPDGELYQGEIWAGYSYFPDFTNGPTRLWWQDWMKTMTDVGVSGFWNDMNEPAVWGQAFPDIVQFEYDGMKKSHKAAHNIYGMQMARASYDGAKKHSNGNRTLIITRAGYAGLQRYSSLWTGDNESTEDDYRNSAVMIQGLNLSGVSFVGADVGGFVGEPSKALFERWIQLGVFTPFFRTHSMINTKAQEPWTFGEDVESNAREMIKTRYKLLPYIYSAFYKSSTKGTPIVKPLFWYDQYDETTYQRGYQYQYYFGDYLLVVAAKVNQDFTKVYLPKGLWYEFDSGIIHNGKQEIIVESGRTRLPVFVRAGGVIPLREPQEYVSQNVMDKIELHIYDGANSENIFYEDDGNTYNYTNGDYLVRKINVNSIDSLLNVSISHDEGKYSTTVKKWEITIHSGNMYKTIYVNNKEISDYEKHENKYIFSIDESKNIFIEIK